MVQKDCFSVLMEGYESWGCIKVSGFDDKAHELAAVMAAYETAESGALLRVSIFTVASVKEALSVCPIRLIASKAATKNSTAQKVAEGKLLVAAGTHFDIVCLPQVSSAIRPWIPAISKYKLLEKAEPRFVCNFVGVLTKKADAGVSGAGLVKEVFTLNDGNGSTVEVTVCGVPSAADVSKHTRIMLFGVVAQRGRPGYHGSFWLYSGGHILLGDVVPAVPLASHTLLLPLTPLKSIP